MDKIIITSSSKPKFTIPTKKPDLTTGLKPSDIVEVKQSTGTKEYHFNFGPTNETNSPQKVVNITTPPLSIVSENKFEVLPSIYNIIRQHLPNIRKIYKLTYLVSDELSKIHEKVDLSKFIITTSPSVIDKLNGLKIHTDFTIANVFGEEEITSTLYKKRKHETSYNVLELLEILCPKSENSSIDAFCKNLLDEIQSIVSTNSLITEKLSKIESLTNEIIILNSNGDVHHHIGSKISSKHNEIHTHGFDLEEYEAITNEYNIIEDNTKTQMKSSMMKNVKLISKLDVAGLKTHFINIIENCFKRICICLQTVSIDIFDLIDHNVLCKYFVTWISLSYEIERYAKDKTQKIYYENLLKQAIEIHKFFKSIQVA